MRAKFGVVPTAVTKIWSFKFISRLFSEGWIPHFGFQPTVPLIISPIQLLIAECHYNVYICF